MTGSDKYTPGGRKGGGSGEGGEGEGKPAVAQRLAAELTEVFRLAQHPFGGMFSYNGRHWEEVTDHSLRARLYNLPGGSKCVPNTRAQALEIVKAAVHREDLVWGQVGPGEVACANGVLDVASGTLRPHEPEDWLESVIPWPWDPRAECPVWLTVLDDWFGVESVEGEQLIHTLQEFFGYVTLAHCRYKKALVLYGPRDSGKSRAMAALMRLAGERYTCVLPVDKMDDPVMTPVLVGKRLNALTDLPADSVLRDGGFKTLVSGEPVPLNPKYGTPYFYKPVAKIAFATNNLPDINDRSDATVGKLLLIPFTRVFAEAEMDPALDDKLAAEGPGIFRWAVEGARRLIARGAFDEPVRAAALMAQIRRESNPVAAFMAEEAMEAPDFHQPLSEALARFNKWNGGSRWQTRAFAKALRGAGFQVEQQRASATGRGTAPVTTCIVGWQMRAATMGM